MNTPAVRISGAATILVMLASFPAHSAEELGQGVSLLGSFVQMIEIGRASCRERV